MGPWAEALNETSAYRVQYKHPAPARGTELPTLPPTSLEHREARC